MGHGRTQPACIPLWWEENPFNLMKINLLQLMLRDWIYRSNFIAFYRAYSSRLTVLLSSLYLSIYLPACWSSAAVSRISEVISFHIFLQKGTHLKTNLCHAETISVPRRPPIKHTDNRQSVFDFSWKLPAVLWHLPHIFQCHVELVECVTKCCGNLLTGCFLYFTTTSLFWFVHILNPPTRDGTQKRICKNVVDWIDLEFYANGMHALVPRGQDYVKPSCSYFDYKCLSWAAMFFQSGQF